MTKSRLFMSGEEFKRLGQKTLALAAGHMADQERTPVHRDLPEETRQQLMSLPLADQGLAPGKSTIRDHAERILEIVAGCSVSSG
jgi:hypothetical protein